MLVIWFWRETCSAQRKDPKAAILKGGSQRCYCSRSATAQNTVLTGKVPVLFKSTISKPLTAKLTATCFTIILHVDYTKIWPRRRGTQSLYFRAVTSRCHFRQCPHMWNLAPVMQMGYFLRHIPALKILLKSSVYIRIYQIELGKLTNQISYI